MRKGTADKEDTTPVVSFGYGFFEATGPSDGATFLSMFDGSTGYIGTSKVRQKGADEFSVQAVVAFLQELGHVRCDIQTDGGSAILALTQAARSVIMASEARHVSTRRSPVHSHAPNGAA